MTVLIDRGVAKPMLGSVHFLFRAVPRCVIKKVSNGKIREEVMLALSREQDNNTEEIQNDIFLLES